jgi:serine/threonine protein kinase
MSIPITSKGFTLFTPVKENEPSTIRWNKDGTTREVTYLVRSSMGFLQRLRGVDEKIWTKVGEGDKAVFFKKEEWKALSDEEQKKLRDFFQTTFQEAIGIAKKVRLEVPEYGRGDEAKEAKKVQTLVKEKLIELVAAARSSPKHTSKLKIPGKTEVIRCELEGKDKVNLSMQKQAGKGSYITAQKMVDFGSTEKISLANKTYAYLKLRDLKTFPPEEIEERLDMFREEIENMEFFAAHGAKNMVKLYQVKSETVKIGQGEREASIGVLMEWCNLGDAKWVTKIPPKPGTSEYIDCIRFVHDVAEGLASLHDPEIGYIHGDVKPENFFLTADQGKLSGRVGDCGSCTKIGDSIRSYSIAYAPPEFLLGHKGKASPQGDSWSFGISLLEIFHGAESNEFAKINFLKEPKEPISEEERRIIANKKRMLMRGALLQVQKKLNPDNPIDALILDCLQQPGRRPTLRDAANRLQALLPPEVSPQKPLSHKAISQHEMQEDQRLQMWKQKALAL